MNDLQHTDPIGATWGTWYWPLWFIGGLLLFLVAELYALSTNPRNTLSYWVWKMLDVIPGAAPTGSAIVGFIAFGVWAILMFWLTIHFFSRLFA